MNPHLPLQPNSVAMTGGGAPETLVAREFAPPSITALLTHTLTAPLRRFRSAVHRYRCRGVLVLLGVSLTAIPTIAQTPESAVEDWGPVLASEAGLLVIPLHVYKNRKSVGGLGEQAFELVEDGVVQNIAFVDGPGGRGHPAEGRTAPIEIILLVDVQHAVRIDLLDTREIRDRFFDGITETVAISVYGFAEKLQRFLGPTRDVAKVQLALEMAYSSGDGHIPILDAIVATARDAASRTRNASRKLVVFSSGLNREIFGAAAHSALDFEIPIYDFSTVESGTVGDGSRYYYAWFTPFLLGRPGPQVQGPSLDQPGNRNQKPRSEPHTCCPLTMELRRETNRIGPWILTNTHPSDYTSDWKHRQNLGVRAYLRALAKVAQNEYFVGYYPSREGDGAVARQVEVRLKTKRIGQLYGGRRVIVY